MSTLTWNPKRVAILTSGGDAPGMNAAVRAASALLLSKDIEPWGVRYGYRGLIKDELFPLQAVDFADIIRDGGTILGSARSPEFMTKEGRDIARDNLKKHQIDGLIIIGGNGSLAGALKLSDPDECGSSYTAPRVIGIPASIDNDIGLTGLAIGVDTAMNTIVEACDKISDTASAFDRTFIIEVMGRDSGYLAMTSAVASAADGVLFPEASRDEDEVVDRIVHTVEAVMEKKQRSRRALIIKAEGTSVNIDALKTRVDAKLADRVGQDRPAIETRVTVLGHVVRGSRPSAFDRLLASRLANVAVSALLQGETRMMAAWMLPFSIPEHVGTQSHADPYCWLVQLDEVLAETQRMHDGTSPLVQWRSKVFEHIEDVLVI